MAIIIWDPSFSVGVDDIDEQHKNLFSMANGIDDALKKGKPADDCADLIGKLKEYAMDHFTSEELFMEGCRYPGLEAHKREHIEFVRKVAEFDRGLRNNTCADPAEILAFLADWLKKHVLSSDMRYATHFREGGNA